MTSVISPSKFKNAISVVGEKIERHSDSWKARMKYRLFHGGGPGAFEDPGSDPGLQRRSGHRQCRPAFAEVRGRGHGHRRRLGGQYGRGGRARRSEGGEAREERRLRSGHSHVFRQRPEGKRRHHDHHRCGRPALAGRHPEDGRGDGLGEVGHSHRVPLRQRQRGQPEDPRLPEVRDEGPGHGDGCRFRPERLRLPERLPRLLEEGHRPHPHRRRRHGCRVGDTDRGRGPRPEDLRGADQGPL